MSKNKPNNANSQTPQGAKKNPLFLLIGAVAVIAVIAIVFVLMNQDKGNAGASNANTARPAIPTTPVANTNTSAPAQPTTPQPTTPPGEEVTTMDVAKAVMVTVEEDFGKNATFADALKQLERRYKPADGQGRTFAILDAYGEKMADGKLHMSMHVSSEKPGEGQIVHKKTGKVLWRGKINSTSQPVPQKALRVIVETSPGNGFNVDVNSADNVMAATASGKNAPVKDVWPDGETREVTFIFSACGCPVKAMVKRVGDKTQRTTDTPVMFPDDPDALKTIARFMRW